MNVSCLSTHLSLDLCNIENLLPTSNSCSDLWVTLRQTDVQVLMSCLWEMGLMSV